jgi:selT/selW/selH-like putative selenoprotein
MDEWKESGAKAHLEIRYCLPCGYVPMAAWIATEFWDEFKGELAITLTPVKDGRLEILYNDATLFDKKAEGNLYPGLDKIRELKAIVKAKLHPVAV